MASKASKSDNLLAEHSGAIIGVIFCGLAAAMALLAMADNLGAGQQAVWYSVLGVIAFVVFATAWSARSHNPHEFFVSGSALSPLACALAGLSGWLAAPAFAGLAGLQFSLGFDGLAFLVGPFAGVFLAGVLFSPYLAASKAATVPAFLGARFGTAVRILSALIIAAALFAVFAAALSAGASLAARTFDIPMTFAVAAAGVTVAACLLPGGMQSLSWTGVAVAITYCLAGVIIVAAASFIGFGHPVVPLAFGQAVQSVSGLEISMIEKGVADASVLKPHTRPFLQIDGANTFGIIFSLMIATAAFPVLLQRSLTVPSKAAARSMSVWLMGLLLFCGLAAAAWAVFAKAEIYTMIARGTSWAALPDWLGELSSQGNVRLHGLSVALVNDVAAVTRNGAQTAQQVADAMPDQSEASAAAWASLKEPVKAAVLQVAKLAPAASAPDYAWTALREKLLPVAAVSSGNKSGFLTLAAVKFDAEALMQTLPQVLRLPAIASAFVGISAIAGMLAIAAAALFKAAIVLSVDLIPSRDAAAPSRGQVWAACVLMLLLGAAGSVLAVQKSIDVAALAPIALAAMAGALFAALAAGIWWRRANAAGALLAMITGLAITLLYAAGTRYAPAALFDLWPAASDAAPAAIRKYSALKSAMTADTGPTATAASAALETLAGGTPYRPGMANWWGLGGASALVFAVPISFLVLVLGSLLGPRPSEAQLEFVAQIRRPDAVADQPFGGLQN